MPALTVGATLVLLTTSSLPPRARMAWTLVALAFVAAALALLLVELLAL